MIPSSIKVAGMTYTVEEAPFIEIDGDRNFQGVCLYRESTIQVLDTLSETRKVQTFVHELTHAIFYEAGFEEQDEDMINRVSLVLHQVLNDRHLEAK